MIVYKLIYYLFVNIYIWIVLWWFVNLECFISWWINRFKSEIMKVIVVRIIILFIIRVFFGFVGCIFGWVLSVNYFYLKIYKYVFF